MLDLIDDAARDKESISLGLIMEAIGNRSFAPLLLLAGLIALSPIGGIPGMPTCTAIIVVLTTGQLIIRKRHFWLPDWLLRRSVKTTKLERTVGWLRRPAHHLDRWFQPRFPGLTRQAGTYFVAIICLTIGIFMPVMELIPFSIHTAGAVLTAFGLSLITQDGVWVIVAFLLAVVFFASLGFHIF